MKNEIPWQLTEDKTLPMTLSEKGLDFKGKTAFFFYFSGILATLSMSWVAMLSIKLLYMAHKDASVPRTYVTIGIMCFGISAVALYSFYKLYHNRKAYSKEITIKDGSVVFLEKTIDGKTEWTEKIKKFDGIVLKHYVYRGVQSWYIVLDHNDKTKNIVLFAPGFEDKAISEDEKRKKLAQYGTLFNLLTTFERPEDTSDEDKSKKE